MAAEFFNGSSSLIIELELEGGYNYPGRSWNTSLQDLMNWSLILVKKTHIFKWFVVCCGFSRLRGASGMVNVLVSIPRSLWGQETLSLLEYSPRLTFIEKATILARIYIFFKTWTAEQSWREGWRPRAQRTSCRRTCGCLGRTGGSQKDEQLAWRTDTWAFIKRRLPNLHILSRISSIFLAGTLRGCW